MEIVSPGLKAHVSTSSKQVVAEPAIEHVMPVAQLALSHTENVYVPTATASLPAAHPEGDRRVLCALVGMMDHPGGAPLRQRHVQCFEHQLGAQMSLQIGRA